MPGRRSSPPGNVRGAEQEIARHDGRPGDMVADLLVIVLRPFVDVADSAAIQNDVREF